MARVERGNVVLTVDDRDVSYYINQGYNLTDDNGKVLQRAIPSNLGELQKLYVDHLERINELEEQVADLTSKLTLKKATPKKVAKSE